MNPDRNKSPHGSDRTMVELTPRLLLVIAVVLAFGASATHGFHYDDYSVIRGVRWADWQTRPITWLSFEANAALSDHPGDHPALWHLVNLVAHLAAVLLLYQLLGLLMPQPAALIGAALFAVHPIQAESVAYVYSRATLFSTVFSIGSCLLWLRDRKWLAVGSFALALLCKEDCATVPLVLLLLERSRVRRSLAAIGAMIALVMLAALHTLMATRVVAGSGAGFSAGISPGAYVLHQGYVVLRYLQLVVIPVGFTIDPEIHISLSVAIASWIVIAALAVWAAKMDRWFLAGLILLIPSSSIFPLADLAADHRMYLPMAAFAGCAALWLSRLPRAAGVFVILVLIGVSAFRMNVWASDAELWKEASERAPGKLRPRIQLSRALPPARAFDVLKSAETIHPDDVSVNAELGRVYLEMGQPQFALAEFGKVLTQKPGDPHAINNRGIALRAMGQEEAAQQDFNRALKINSCFEEARRNLGLAPCAASATAK